MSDELIVKETSLFKRKKKLIIIIAVLAIIAVIGIFFAVKHFSKDSDKGKVYVESVAEITGYGSLGVADRFNGVVESQKAVNVNADNSKTIKTCFVNVGDQVTAGTQLFEYDTDEINQSIDEHKLEIDKLNIQINSAKQQITQLESEKASAPADEQLNYTMEIQSLNSEIASNQYDANSKQAELDKLQASLANAVVTSTVDGIIKSIGDSAGSGSDYDSEYSGGSNESAYISILPIGDYQIKGVLTELNMDSIQQGAEVIISSRVDSSKKVKGTVSSIDFNNPVSDSGTDSGVIYDSDNEGSSSGESASKWNFYVTFENTENLVLGQHVFVEPDYGQTTDKKGLWLPEFYLDKNKDDSYFVWKESKGKLIKQKLELGEYDSDTMEYEILKGLTADDYIAFPSDELATGKAVTHSIEEAEPIDSIDDSGDEGALSPDGEDVFSPADGEDADIPADDKDAENDDALEDSETDDISEDGEEDESTSSDEDDSREVQK